MNNNFLPYQLKKNAEQNSALAASLAQKTKQTTNLASFYKKITLQQGFKVVCRGDSLTYGQDTVSADKRPASTTPTDTGVAHTQTRAGVSYPEALQTNLQAVYGSGVTVINKGYSGDWVAGSLEKWTNDSTTDAVLIMLGTNDSTLSASWIDASIRGNIARYLSDMRTMIESYLNNGTAVFLLTPPRLYNQEIYSSSNNQITESYRNALVTLGLEYNVPVIDAEVLMNGWDQSYYSDSVHLNTKGYTAFAARLSSLLVGMFNGIPKVKSGDSLGVRVTRDNLLKTSGVSFSTSTGSEGSMEGATGQGLLADIPASNSLYYSFETTEENLILIPIYSLAGGATIQSILDFGVEQGSPDITAQVNQLSPPSTTKPLSTISSTVNTTTSAAYDGTINTTTTDRYLQVTNKGLHNIKVSNTGTGDIYFNGFVIVSFKDFIKFGGSGGGTPIKNNYFQIYLPSTYQSPAPSIASSDLLISDLKANFSFPDIAGLYYEGVPLKITLTNSSGPGIANVIEYAFVWNDTTGDGTSNRSGFFFLGQLRRTDNGTPSIYRTITGMTYDYVNKKYVINYGGNLDCYSNILITPL